MFHVFIGGIHMEANSFNPVYSTQETFTSTLKGHELETMRGTSLELGGVYDCLEAEKDVRIIPGFFAQACTSGPVKGEDFTALSQMLFESLEKAGQVDGVLLILHGAMQSEFVDDCEGYLIERIRHMVGPDIPICASFDFHALMTTRIMEHLNGAEGYLTYPHVDHFETGKRAAQSLLYLLRSRIKPYQLCRHIPLIMSCENSNTIDSPLVPAMDMVKDLLREDGILSGSIFLTQPWLDTPDLGCSVCVFAEDKQKRAQYEKRMEDILRYLWENRSLFYPPMPSVQEALSRIDSMQKPALLVDYGDVPNAGGTGDGTVMLQAFLNSKLPFPSVVVVADAQSTKQAVEVGAGNSALFMVGGFGKPGEFNARIPVQAKVLRLNPEPFVHLGPAQKGYINRPGMRALLQAGNVYIILTQQVSISHDQNMLLTMGLDPRDMGIISMRATHSFLSCYADVMGSWMYVDTPGFSTRDLKTLPYQKCKRPIYPLDDLQEFRINEVI